MSDITSAAAVSGPFHSQYVRATRPGSTFFFHPFCSSSSSSVVVLTEFLMPVLTQGFTEASVPGPSAGRWRLVSPAGSLAPVTRPARTIAGVTDPRGWGRAGGQPEIFIMSLAIKIVSQHDHVPPDKSRTISERMASWRHGVANASDSIYWVTGNRRYIICFTWRQ